LTNQIADAFSAYQAALDIWRSLHEPIKEGETLRWLSRIHWFAGRNEEAEATGRAALAVLEPLPPGPQLAWAYSNLAQLRMLASDNEGAIDWGERAITLAEHLDAPKILVPALNTVGTARMNALNDQGRVQLERSLALALDARLEEHAARAWTNLSSSSFHLHRLANAERYLADGIAYAAEHDLDSWQIYMTSCRARVHLFQGAWAASERDCAWVLRQPHAAAISRIVALTTLGRLRARRGDPDAITPLDEALKLANPTGELQRIGPVRTARAEAAWQAGDLSRVVGEVRALLDMPHPRPDSWLRGEIAWWLCQMGEAELPGGEIAEPFALQVAGDWAAAANAWETLGYPHEAARARAASYDEANLRSAFAVFERLGAVPAATTTLQRLREIGARSVSRGPRSTTRANPAGLTSREAEILELVVEGQTNREIADGLFLSPKTVEHHISSILGKLDVPTRRDAARVAADLGFTPSRHTQMPS
jgi:DNA-binding CsgD family transcriptional regulator/tetratricopeptide (TPR) repeat protein